MATPRRLTIALGTTLWCAVCAACLWLPLQFAVFPLFDRLPDNRYVGGVTKLLLAAGIFAFTKWAADALPFWRDTLTNADRRHLRVGCGMGALASFLVLPADLTAPVQSPRAMAVMAAVVVACSFAGALVAAATLPVEPAEPVQSAP